MRIGVFTGSSVARDGGGGTFRAGLMEALQTTASRHEFIVFGLQSEGNEDSRESPITAGLKSRLGSLPLVGSLGRRTWRALHGARDSGNGLSPEEQFIADNRIEIAWFTTPIANPVSVPYIATVWDLEHRKQPYFPEVNSTGWSWESRERNYRALLPRASRILTGTEAGKKELVVFYGIHPENVRVVPLTASAQNVGVDTAGILAKYGIHRPFIYYPAQFWPHKNHVNLLLALKLLNDGEPMHLVLTGSDQGNLGYVKETIDKLGLAAQVHILGFLPREDLVGLYCQAEALVCPTFFGPDNLPPLEAFASGCPVAASNLQGAGEQLGDAALLFDPTDPQQIAEAVRRIRGDADFRAKLIQLGRERVERRTPQEYLKQVCRILDEFEPIRRCWGTHYVHA